MNHGPAVAPPAVAPGADGLAASPFAGRVPTPEQWPAFDALLDDALSHPPEARGAWLDALPPEHATLAPLLRRVLAAGARVETGDLLATGPRLMAGARTEGESPVAHAEGPSAGDTVGPWKLVRPIGEGGMGSVWLAERADGQLKRPAALKLPRLAWAPGLVARLARERDILATLEHPNIARLHDAGVDALGRPWLALEHVEGQPIDRWARERGASVRRRVELLLQVCEAVAYAHRRLVIHRDLKPSNILVTDAGQVKLLDFGIAKLVEEGGAGAASTALTQAAGRAFTPDYASPEQVRGEPLTTASDVYSLAVVAYELLAGERPYRLDRPSAAALEEAFLAAEVPPASRRAQDEATRKALRGDLDAIVAKALAKRPPDRYVSVEALAADWRRHLEGAAVSARPQTLARRALRSLRQHPAAVLIAFGAALALLGGAYAQVAVAIALAAGAALAVWQRNEALKATRRAEAEAREAQVQTREAVAVASREEMLKITYVEAFSEIAAWRREQFERPLAVATLLREKVAQIEVRHHDDPEAVFAVQDAVMVQLPFMGDFEGSIAIGQRLAAGLRAAGAKPWRIQRTGLAIGRALKNLGRLEASIDVLRDALRHAADDDAAIQYTVRVRVDLALALRLSGQREAAMQALEPAVALMERHGGGVVQRHEVFKAWALLYSGHDDALALEHAQAACDAYDRDMHGQIGERAGSLLHLGEAQWRCGRAAEAERSLRQSLEGLDSLYGPADRDCVLVASMLGSALSAQARHEEAEAVFTARRGVLSALGDAADPLGLKLLAAHALADALDRGDARAAHEIEAAAAGLDFATRDTRRADLWELGRVRLRGLAGAPADALARALQGVASRPPHLRRDPRAAALMTEAGLARLADGNACGALADIDEALGMLRENGIRSTTVAAAHAARAQALLALGRTAEARQALSDAEGALSQAGLRWPTRTAAAGFAMTTAGVCIAEGNVTAARRALADAAVDLVGQHPDSPRLRAYEALSKAASEARHDAGAAAPASPAG
jgi:serine/threonine-protein kinase